MTTDSRFAANHTCAQTACNICGSDTLVLSRRRHSLDTSKSWDSESIMKILGLTTVEGTLRLCPRCLHIFRSPLYDESLVYGEAGTGCRKEAYERHFPERTFRGGHGRFGASWFLSVRDVFSYVGHVLSRGAFTGMADAAASGSLKILDWGGGDGYVGETVALVSEKALGLKCKAYCFDAHTWAPDPRSPYFEYLASDQIADKAPYDIVILSHVLEHMAFPIDIVNRCARWLAERGTILIVVPYEQPQLLLTRDTSPSSHQSAFSATSMRRLLAECGFDAIDIDLRRLSYRVFPMWNIIAAARRGGGPSRAVRLSRLTELRFLTRVASGALRRRFLGRIRR